MTGALMQLVAYGAQDVYLSGNPQMTFFKTVYRRHTNFSMECIKQDLKGTVGAGSRVVATLARRGDLVHDCFLKLKMGKTKAGHNPGHNMIDNIECEIGGQLIDKHFGHWMEAHAELTEKSYGEVTVDDLDTGGGISSGGGNKRCGMFATTACAGGVKTFPQGHPGAGTIFQVPLRFWFCRHVGLSLPLIALQYHEVNINVKFNSGESAEKIVNDDAGGNVSLWCNYIYLDTDERRRFAQVSHEYLIEQVQLNTFSGTAAQTFKLNFNHPVKELVWVGFVTGNAFGTNPNTSGTFTCMAADHASTTQLKLNGHDRFEKLESTYFSRYQIYKYHTGCPGTNTIDEINVYSFALKPEEHQPSGTCNFSRIDNAQLIFSNINSDIDDIFVYAVNYNVLRIMSGMGGLAYSN